MTSTATATGPDLRAPDLSAMRISMVASQLRPNAVNDPRVVTAMALVPRERFLPEHARVAAYRDTLIPLGRGRSANMPISTGRLLTQAELRPTDRVLLIGAAGGYAAAVLAEIVTEVVAVEQDPALVALAREALSGMPKVTLVEGALNEGCPDRAPYDVLLIDGAVEVLPDALVAQVAPGGRIATGIVDRGVTRLTSGRRVASGYGLQPFADAESAILPGFERPRGFQF